MSGIWSSLSCQGGGKRPKAGAQTLLGEAEDSGRLCGHPVFLQGSVCLCCAGTRRGCVFLSCLAGNVHDLCFFLKTQGSIIKDLCDYSDLLMKGLPF